MTEAASRVNRYQDDIIYLRQNCKECLKDKLNESFQSPSSFFGEENQRKIQDVVNAVLETNKERVSSCTEAALKEITGKQKSFVKSLESGELEKISLELTLVAKRWQRAKEAERKRAAAAPDERGVKG